MSALIAAALLAAFTTFEEPPRRVNGLTAELIFDQTRLSLGTRIDFETSLLYDPLPSEATAMLLAPDDGEWRFAFVSRDTTAVYWREPFDAGLPVMESRLRDPRLSSGWKHRVGHTVHLLSPAGGQIPPGRYHLFAVYSNTRPGESLAPTSTGNDTWWTGVISSEPASIAVVPVGPRTVSVAVPGIVIEPRGDNLAWRWNTASAQNVDVSVRPGYATGINTTGHALVSGQRTNHAWHGQGGITFSDSRFSGIPPELSRRSLAGEPLELIVVLEVFESSIQPQHLWEPDRGDYRVLWRGEVRGTYP